MSELSLINTNTGGTLQVNATSSSLTNSNTSGTTSSSQTQTSSTTKGGLNLYTNYISDTGVGGYVPYYKSVVPTEPQTITGNVSFTISGTYTVSGTTITAGSGSQITCSFTGAITGSISIPFSGIISGLGGTVNSYPILSDKTSDTLSVKITFTIKSATGRFSSMTASISGGSITTNYGNLGQTATYLAPGSTNSFISTSTISGASGNFTTITVPSQQTTSHTVYL